jgi:hypothetical protein
MISARKLDPWKPGQPNPAPVWLQSVADDLRDPGQRIETTFLEVGARLAQCAGILVRISSTFEALPKDLESAELVDAVSRLGAVGHRAQEMVASFAAERETIAAMNSAVSAAHSPLSDLRRTVKMIGIVALNARVVAASVADQMDGVEVFTTDIAALATSAATAVRTFTESYERVVAEVQKAQFQHAHFEATHSETLNGLATRLVSHLEELARQRKQSANGSARTGTLSRQIAMRVATVVSALQVGDTTRQRVEHAEAALRSLAGMVGGSEPGEGFLIDAVCRLQAAQLGDTVSGFDGEVLSAAGALRELAVDAAEVVEQSRSLYGEGKGQSSLNALSDEVRLAARLLRDCESERQKLDALAAGIGAIVRSLLDQVEAVQAIEANMRLVSLNAAVKCAQLGPRGRALDVIAQQLRQLTGETVVCAEAALASLDKAAGVAEKVSAAAASNAANQVGQLEEEARTSVALLATVDKRLGDALALLGRDGPEAVATLGTASESFTLQSEIGEALADIQFRLEGFAVTANAAESVETETLGTLLAQLRKHYTMDSERQLHDAMFPGSAIATIAAEPEPEAADTEEDIDALLF